MMYRRSLTGKGRKAPDRESSVTGGEGLRMKERPPEEERFFRRKKETND